MDKKGVLLINIGSPDSYQVKDVRKYLRLFLMDKEIINLPFLLRWILVHWIIVPRRGPFSAANYKKIWMTEGSPLIVYSRAFKKKLQESLGPQYIVRTGMAFSSPNIEEALLDLHNQDVEKILVVPLFPQYAAATTGSVSQEVRRVLRKHRLQTPVKWLEPFYADSGYIENSGRIAREFLRDKSVEHYLFSYHGLPESQIRRNDFCRIDKTCCLQEISCLKNCYRAQCLKNSELLAQSLGLRRDQWTFSFQSRLGRAKWIGPSTEETLKDLVRRGKKNIAVLCPSFVADCIETLEEIGIGGRETFHAAGGEEFHLVPCLNDDENWSKSFANLCARQI
jgi:ferrochelatase